MKLGEQGHWGQSVVGRDERQGCGGQRGSRDLDFQFSSVQFSSSVMSDSLRPHELQHTRPPCPSPTARVHPNPYTLSW